MSYSHDSLAHRQRVLALALELCAGGVDCELDQFHEGEPPPEGWPAWMHRQVTDADYVIVVCSERYYLRATGREAEGVGLGARWEAQLITQALYDAGGQNAKFIPVVFEAKDLAYRPEFLRPTTYYDVATPSRREDLYWRLTKQPGVVKPPLGQPRRRSEPLAGVGPTGGPALAPLVAAPRPAQPDLLLIREPGGRLHFIPLVSTSGGETQTAVLQPDTDDERAYLERLCGSRYALSEADFAWGLRAVHARLDAATHTRERGQDQFTLKFTSDVGSHGYAGGIEMSTQGYSAEAIAQLRARRILLDETLATGPGHRRPGGEGTMLDVLVQGLNTKLAVERSPLPATARLVGRDNPARLAAAARLTGVLWLRLSGTVADVLRLDVSVTAAATLAINFRGTRAQFYSNVEPAVIEVVGECPLGSS